MRTSVATIPRMASLAAQFVTFCGFVVIVAGLATLQHKTDKSPNPVMGTADYDTTRELFQSALLTPYPDDHHFQFAFIWFIIFFQFTMLVTTLGMTLMPRMWNIGKLATFTLLAVAMTLTINVVNNLTYLHKSAGAKGVYGSRDINVTFAGSLLVVLGNVFTIITLGMWTPETEAAYPVTTNKREADLPHTAAHTGAHTGTHTGTHTAV